MADGTANKYRQEVSLPPTAAEAGIDDLERRMLADILHRPHKVTVGGSVPQRIREAEGERKSSAAPETLTLSLLRRVQELEDVGRNLRGMLIAKEQELLSFRRSTPHASGVEELQHENDCLRHQIADMEAFLHDYGLVWVGHRSDENVAAAGTPLGPVANDAVPISIDFSILFLRLKQLNELVGAGIARVVKKDGVHKFEVPIGTPLAIYRNGFLLNRGPFREYQEPAAKTFIQVGYRSQCDKCHAATFAPTTLEPAHRHLPFVACYYAGHPGWVFPVGIEG